MILLISGGDFSARISFNIIFECFDNVLVFLMP